MSFFKNIVIFTYILLHEMNTKSSHFESYHAKNIPFPFLKIFLLFLVFSP